VVISDRISYLRRITRVQSLEVRRIGATAPGVCRALLPMAGSVPAQGAHLAFRSMAGSAPARGTPLSLQAPGRGASSGRLVPSLRGLRSLLRDSVPGEYPAPTLQVRSRAAVCANCGWYTPGV